MTRRKWRHGELGLPCPRARGLEPFHPFLDFAQALLPRGRLAVVGFTIRGPLAPNWATWFINTSGLSGSVSTWEGPGPKRIIPRAGCALVGYGRKGGVKWPEQVPAHLWASPSPSVRWGHNPILPASQGSSKDRSSDPLSSAAQKAENSSKPRSTAGPGLAFGESIKKFPLQCSEVKGSPPNSHAAGGASGARPHVPTGPARLCLAPGTGSKVCAR